RNIKLEIASDLPTVLANREDLITIYYNLFDNAIKYLGDNKNPKIEVGWEEQKNFYVFWVKDNGIGVSKEFQEKVFDLFHRGSASRKIEGTGVGLAIVKRIVERHRGVIRLSSDIGKGSTVYFTLPKAERLITQSNKKVVN
ncbi:MAG: ATP-binding protein, partial [bacterium]